METNLSQLIQKELDVFFEDTDLFVVEIVVLPSEKIKIFADGEKNITIDQCVKISRHMEEYLESNNLVSEKYSIEVSSPGMDLPLRVKRQYEKSKGREVSVLLNNGERFDGLLEDYSDDGVTIKVEKKKKGKILESKTMDFSFVDIKSTTKKITFK